MEFQLIHFNVFIQGSSGNEGQIGEELIFTAE